MRIFGSRCLSLIPPQKRGKLDSRAAESIFLGIATDHRAYRLWDPLRRVVFFSRDVQVIESCSRISDYVVFPPESEELPSEHDLIDFDSELVPIPQSPPGLLEPPQTVQPHSNQPVSTRTIPNRFCPISNPVDPVPNPCTQRLRRKRKLPNGFAGFEVQLPKSLRADPHPEVFSARVDPEPYMADEPTSLKRALESPECESWKRAAQVEYDELQKNETYVLVDLTANANLITSRWVFKKKIDSEGRVDHRARLVARGYKQIPGVDFEETYAPVVRMSTIRLLFAVSAQEGYFFFILMSNPHFCMVR